MAKLNNVDSGSFIHTGSGSIYYFLNSIPVVISGYSGDDPTYSSFNSRVMVLSKLFVPAWHLMVAYTSLILVFSKSYPQAAFFH